MTTPPEPEINNGLVRVVVVVNWERGSVHGVTTSIEEAQGWARALLSQYPHNPVAATMTAALVRLESAP